MPDVIVYRVVTMKAPKGVKPYNIEPPIRIPVPRPKC